MTQSNIKAIKQDLEILENVYNDLTEVDDTDKKMKLRDCLIYLGHSIDHLERFIKKYEQRTKTNETV